MEYNITNYTGFTIIDEHKENLLSEYIKGSSLMELSNLYNYNISTIRYFLRKCGIKTRGIKESVEKFHKLNSLVIDNVLHENILGWLLGDGCSTKYIKSYNHRGSITCKYKNEYILEQFIDISKNPIGCYKSNNCYNYHFNNKALINLLDYIGECPVESYKYKWIVRRKSTVSDKTCPSCGEDSLVYEEGCLVCKSCGYGKC